MEAVNKIQDTLIDNINEGVEGEVVAYCRDEKRSMFLYLEKIEDPVKRLKKFRLHIILWSTDILKKLIYPLIFLDS